MVETSPSLENSSTDGESTYENPTSSTPMSEKSANKLSENTFSITETEILEPKRNMLGDVRVQNQSLWKPGQSGNPEGRPKGSKNRITRLKLSLEEYLRNEAADHMRDILLTAIKKAKKGDNQMIKLLLELHMSKSGEVDDRSTDDKITININSMKDNEKSVIDITPTAKE